MALYAAGILALHLATAGLGLLAVKSKGMTIETREFGGYIWIVTAPLLLVFAPLYGRALGVW